MKQQFHSLIRIVTVVILFLVCLSIVLLPATSVSADLRLYEHYNASWFDTFHACDNNWLGQTFTASSDHTVNAIKLYLGRFFCGGPDTRCNPGIIHVIIKSISATGIPVGQILSSGTINGDNFPAGESWQMITMSECNLSAGARYAIILYNNESCDTGVIAWLVQDNNPFPSGNLIESSDGGNNWTPHNSFDFNFEIWGGPIALQSGGNNNYTFFDSSSSNPQQTIFSTPPDIKVLNISSQPAVASAGQPIKIMANVVNRGNLPGSFKAVLKINNSIESSRQIAVPGDQAIPVEFTVYKDEPGNYTAELNGQKIYFSIVAGEKSTPVTDNTMAYIVLGILILAAVVIFIRYITTRQSD
jgi:hypothetical protein